MDDKRGTIVIENPVPAFSQRSHCGEQLELDYPALRHGDIRHVTRVHPCRVLYPVLPVGGIEVRSRRSEWRLARAHGVDVKRVLAGRQIVELRGDQYAVRRLREGGRANRLARYIGEVRVGDRASGRRLDHGSSCTAER